MSSASARAEARRKAILSRGTDRLAKLTTSARGEDSPAYLKDLTAPSTSSTRSFLGEDTPSDMPAPSQPTFAPSPSPSPQPSSAFTRSPALDKSTTTSSSSAPSTASTPPHTTHKPLPSLAGRSPGTAPDPTVWSLEEQQQFMRALMAGNASTGFAPGQTPLQSPLGDPTDPVDPTLPPMDNPLAALLFGAGAGAGAGGMGGMGGQGSPQMDLAAMFGGGGPGGPAMGGMGKVDPPKPEPKYKKFLPIVHLVLLWSLLGYFVFFVEPRVYKAGLWKDLPVGSTMWERWGALARRSDAPRKIVVSAAPFFYAFLTLEIILHSLLIFTNTNSVQLPSLLALALPHLPPPIPSVVVTLMKYLWMGGRVVDDLAGVVVGLGFVVYFSSGFGPAV